MPEFGAPAGRHRHKAPEQTTAQNEVLAPEPIHNKPGQQRASGIDPHESRPDPAELLLIKTKFLFELGENRENRLAICFSRQTQACRPEPNLPDASNILVEIQSQFTYDRGA